MSELVTATDWRDDIFVALKAADIRQVGYVPDAGHTRLIERCQVDPDIAAVSLTTEEEGVALAAGAWLGGQRPVLLMQSSGVGNCINMLSLTKACRFPLTMIITMRGEWAEFNPWQVSMGRTTQAALELMDVLVYRVDAAAEVGETVTAALDIAFNGSMATAVLLSQRLIGAKKWVKWNTASHTAGTNDPRLERRAAMKTLLTDRGEMMVVTGLGSTTYDAAAAGDHDRNFYLWGAMGGATMIGLGMAIAQPDKTVLVVTGDGEMLMGLGSLATVGVQHPPNLAIAIFDNGHYAETGMQASHTNSAVDLCGVARSCGIEAVYDISGDSALQEFTARLKSFDRTMFARVAIVADEPPRVLPTRDGVLLKTRFRRSLGFE